MRTPRFRVPPHFTRIISLFAMLALGLIAFASTAQACSCMRRPLHEALASSDFVADIRVLEVGPLDENEGQYLLYRIERIYKAPATIAEGDEIWVYHQTCNSTGYEATEVGGRRIWFMGIRQGVPTHHYCSTSLDSDLAVSHFLLESRARWQESR